MSPVGLEALLKNLPPTTDANVLVGFDTRDDAGVYRLTDDLAIVCTADFITPPVDDPYIFGQIAAANALSDIYAMGAKPLVCLNLVGFPADKLPQTMLYDIVRGALSKILEAQAQLLGGHTVADDEPKFGLSVTGIVHPNEIWRNATAQAGDALILTKPIGSGVLFNANRKKWLSNEDLDSCLSWVTMLNRSAMEILKGFKVHAATDITGFGLAGHTLEMAKGANLTFKISFSSIPIMPQALNMYMRGVTTGANQANLNLVERDIEIATALSSAEKSILIDPQTNGGLLFAVPSADAPVILDELHAKGLTLAANIGSVHPFNGKTHLIISSDEVFRIN